MDTDMAMLKSINPATNEVVGEVPLTDPATIPTMVEAARKAQHAWGAMPFQERAAILLKAAALLTQRAEDIGRLITQEMGKPLKEAVGEASLCASLVASDLEEIESALAPETLESGKTRSTVYRDPFGVAACITPWNFPVLMPHQEVLPALAAGNAVLFKPSEETPLTGQAYADAFISVLPDNVLQVVHGAEAQGKALVASNVDLIVFTGSRDAGKHILAEASKGLKRVILELGGKDPLIVLEDADLTAAAKFASKNGFRNAGQVCVSTERIYVHESVHGDFVEALAKKAGELKVGDGLEQGTTMGPLVHQRQRDHVQKQVEGALAQGAQTAWQGEAPGGNFLPPTILTQVTHDMAIARDETFGPVVCVTSVKDEAEAVQKANDTPYGLGAVVFGEQEHARKVARKLTAGMVGVNQGLAGAPGAPWVGARESGYGFHSGRDGHRQFAQVRVINEALSD